MLVRCSMLFLLASAVVPAGASAQESDPDAEARRLFLRGDALYAEGEYGRAVVFFEEAYALSGRPALLFNLANAYERLERLDDAIDALRRYRTAAPPDAHAPIDARLARLEARAATEPAPAEPPEIVLASTEPNGLATPGFVLLASGGALVAAGLVAALLTLGPRADLEDLCVDGICRAGADDAIDRDATFSILADIGLFGGGVIALVGLVLVLLDDPGEEGPVTAALAGGRPFVGARSP